MAATLSKLRSTGFRRVAVLLPLAGALLLVPAGCKHEVEHGPDVWAVVNGQEIKRADVDKYYRTRVNPEGQEPSQEEALSLKLNVLDELINNEILLERAKKLNLEASDGEVEDKFTELKSPYTEEEFQRQLKERNVSVGDLKADLRRQLSITKLLNREVVAKITITDQDVTEFYNANKAQFNVAEPQYRIAQIVVTPRKEPQIRNRKNDDATNDAEAQRKVKMLMDRLNSGADFAQLAMDYSEDMNSAATGGDLGYVPESALEPVRSDAEENGHRHEARPGQPAAQPKRRLPHFEIGHARIARPAQHFRSRKSSKRSAIRCAIAKSSCFAPRIWQSRATKLASATISPSKSSKPAANSPKPPAASSFQSGGETFCTRCSLRIEY